MGAARSVIKEEGFVWSDDMRIKDKFDRVIDKVFVQVVALLN